MAGNLLETIEPASPLRSLAARMARGIAWRVAGVRSRWRDRFPPFRPVVREIAAISGRSSTAVAADVLHTWMRLGWQPPEYAALMLWQVPRARRSDFLTAKDIDPFLSRRLDPDDQFFGRDKVECAEHARAHGVPWVPTLAVINRRQGCAAKDARRVERDAELWPAIEGWIAAGDVVLKPAFGLQGRGFFAVMRDGRVLDADGASVPRERLVRRVFEYNRAGTAYGYLAQPFLRAHPDLAEVTGVTALTTVRVVTVLHESGDLVLQSFLKIPAPGRLTDNFRRGVSGTFITAIDPESGRLGELVGIVRAGYRHGVERAQVHPQTSKRIAGAELPMWRDCFAMARRAAVSHPTSPIFSWDIALTPDGWVVLEANAIWGPVGAQTCTRQGLRPTLARLYPGDWA